MLPASLAFGWSLWRRHRLGLLVVLGHLMVAVAAAVALTAAPLDRGTVTPLLGLITASLLCPAAYLIAVFSSGFDVDVMARESCFPPAMFRLPVPTSTLVGWLMVYGAGAILLFWLVTAWFILEPCLSPWNMHVPLWWSAGLAVATMACFQAMLWVPVGITGFRVVLAALLVCSLVIVPQVGVAAGVSQGILAALFAGLTGLAWTAGYLGVRHARRGSIPNWDFVFQPLRELAHWLPRRRQPFSNSARAQVWFEWRRTGGTLPFMTGLVLPFVLLPLFFGKNEAIPLAVTLLGALAVPVFLAGLAGTTVSGNHPWVKDYYGVTPFTATLPTSTALLVSAKLKAAALSTLTAWSLLAVLVVSAFALTGNMEEVVGWWRQGQRAHEPLKIIAGVGATAIFLVVWTWKRLLDSLLLGLTGRKWLIQGNIFLGMLVFFGLGVMAKWIYQNLLIQEDFLAVLPWLLGLWALCRLLASAWALHQVLRQGLVLPRTVLRWLLSWLLLGAALFGVFAWVVPGELVPMHYLPFIVLLALPMTHLAAAPLALAWNRHR